MRQERNQRLGTDPAITFAIGNVRWRVHMVRATQVASDWFLHFVAIGPRTHTIFLRSDRPPVAAETWWRLRSRLRGWLGENNPRRCAVLDLHGSF